MKNSTKAISAICLLISITLYFCGCSLIAKQREKHLYNWLLENGQLLNGTDLEYKQTGAVGDLFVLRYSSGSSSTMFIEYSTHSDEYQITVKVPLFSKTDKVLARIEVENEAFEYRGLEYYHNTKEFTRNSPVTHHEWYGNTTSYALSSTCEEFAQTGICKILDWMKDSLCPATGMKLSDFGYSKYQ